MKPIFIAGPCVIESAELLQTVAGELVRIRQTLGDVELIFKASFDKANRTSLKSFRGPGLERGLQMLSDIREQYHLPITTDVHESYQAEAAGEVSMCCRFRPSFAGRPICSWRPHAAGVRSM